MNSDKSSPITPAPPGASHRVSLSPYVNEQFPNWEEMLSAHDVARLTRRPRWMVLSLALLGRFPRKRRFHGRAIGWSRSDVLTWLRKDLRTTQCHINPVAVARSRVARQGLLPLDFTPRCARRHRRRLRSTSRSAQRHQAPTLAINPPAAWQDGPEIRS